MILGQFEGHSSDASTRWVTHRLTVRHELYTVMVIVARLLMVERGGSLCKLVHFTISYTWSSYNNEAQLSKEVRVPPGVLIRKVILLW